MHGWGLLLLVVHSGGAISCSSWGHAMHGCQFQQWRLNWGQRHAMAAVNHFLEARHVQVNSLAVQVDVVPVRPEPTPAALVVSRSHTVANLAMPSGGALRLDRRGQCVPAVWRSPGGCRGLVRSSGRRS